MHVRTFGRNDKLSSRELREATKFMGSILFSRQLYERLRIKIESHDVIVDDPSKYGDAFVLDASGPRFRNFRIRLCTKRGRRSQLLTLGHELVHVRQYATGQLKTWQHKTVWKSERLPTNIAEHKLPHEVEARSYEKMLYRAYIQYCYRGE